MQQREGIDDLTEINMCKGISKLQKAHPPSACRHRDNVILASLGIREARALKPSSAIVCFSAPLRSSFIFVSSLSLNRPLNSPAPTLCDRPSYLFRHAAYQSVRCQEYVARDQLNLCKVLGYADLHHHNFKWVPCGFRTQISGSPVSIGSSREGISRRTIAYCSNT